MAKVKIIISFEVESGLDETLTGDEKTQALQLVADAVGTETIALSDKFGNLSISAEHDNHGYSGMY